MAEIKSNDAWSKQPGCTVDQISEMLERFNNRLRLGDTRLVERYSKFELHIWIEFRIRGIDEQFVACFQRAKFVGWSEKHIHLWDRSIGPHFLHHGLHDRLHGCSDINRCEGGTYRDKQTVLIDVVKSIEDPEFMSLPSFVWFDTAERVNCILPQRLYCSTKEGLKLRGFIENGEIELGVGSCVWPLDKHLTGQMIEGASQVVDAVCGNDRDIRGDRYDARYVINHLAGLRIALGSNGIWVGCEESVADFIEIDEVFFGPFDL